MNKNESKKRLTKRDKEIVSMPRYVFEMIIKSLSDKTVNPYELTDTKKGE